MKYYDKCILLLIIDLILIPRKVDEEITSVLLHILLLRGTIGVATIFTHFNLFLYIILTLFSC